MIAAAEVAQGELVLPEPVGKQGEWLDSPATRKVLQVGRRGGKTRFAFLAALLGHGPMVNGEPALRGVLQGGDVVWIAQNYPNLSTVLWREEVVPRMGHLPWVSLNAQRHDVEIPGVGALMLRSGDREAIDSIRGIGKRLFGVIVDEAAWLDLRGALQDVILLALADNDGWLIIMSTTNAGNDGGYDDTGAPQVPSYFNLLCAEIIAGKRTDDWQRFEGTAFDNPELSAKAIQDLINEYPPDSPKLKQEVYAELLETGVGLALPGLSEKTHLVPAFSPPDFWNGWAAFDWGYHHPWVLTHYTIDDDGQVYCRETLFGRQDLPEQIHAKVKAAGVDPSKLVIHGSPDAWDTRIGAGGKVKGQFTGPTVAEELLSLGWKLIPAANARIAGLNNMRRYTHIPPERPDVRPRFLWMDTPGNRIALAQCARMPIDPDRPEDALKVDADAAGRGGDDAYDCCLASDTIVHTSDGDTRIADLVGRSGFVQTPVGWRAFHSVRQTRDASALYRVRTTDGRAIDLTADHEVLTLYGWCRADALGRHDNIVVAECVDGYIALHGHKTIQRQDLDAQPEWVFPVRAPVSASRGLDCGGWTDPTWSPSAPQGQEPAELRSVQSGMPALDGACATASAGTGEDELRSLHPQFGQDSGAGSALASIAVGQGVARGTLERDMVRAVDADAHVRALRRSVSDASDGQRIGLLLESLQECRTQSARRGQRDEAVPGMPRSVHGQPIRSPGDLFQEVRVDVAPVASVERIGVGPTYNMEVDGVHCFAVNGGLVVHNCRYGLMARPIHAVLPAKPDEEGRSMGFDFAKGRPRERESGDAAMEKLFGTPTGERSGRYRVPVRRG